MFDTSKALKTGRTFAEKALAFARETTVVKDFEADVKRVLTPKADTAPARRKYYAEAGLGVSVAQIADSMPADGAPEKHLVDIEVSRFGVSLRIHGAADGLLMHIVNGNLMTAKIDSDGRVLDESVAPVAPTRAQAQVAQGLMPEVGITGTSRATTQVPAEPTRPEFNVTPVKRAILRHLSGATAPTTLSDFHTPTVGLCRDHGWIREADKTDPAQVRKRFSLTDAGLNALAWHDQNEKG